MIQKEQAAEVGKTLDLEKKKVGILQDKQLIERCEAFLEEYVEQERLKAAAEERKAARAASSEEVLKLYEDFDQCLKPMLKLNAALMEAGDDILQMPMIHLSDAADFIDMKLGRR